MNQLVVDAEALYRDLLAGVRGLWKPGSSLVGIWSGGAWLAERLQADLGLPGPPGLLSITLHRDDFGARGLVGGVAATQLPFAVDGSDLILIDDVLFTGRTIRAAINELFDYGRPASVRLAVLVDRGDRQLPIAADCSAAKLHLPQQQRLSLARDAGGSFSFSIDGP